MAEFRHSELFWTLFDAGWGFWRRRRLAPTQVAGVPESVPADRPLILIANHVSWWDGFLLRELQRSLRPGAPFHTVVLRRQLERHPILRRLGGIELDPGDRASVRRLLRGLARYRPTAPDLVLSYFPQGRIWPATRRPLGFHRGIEAVRRALAPATLLPVAIRLEPLVDPRPTPFLWIGAPFAVSATDGPSAEDLEQAVTEGLDRIGTLLDMNGEGVLDHWPDPGFRADGATTATPDRVPHSAAPR